MKFPVKLQDYFAIGKPLRKLKNYICSNVSITRCVIVSIKGEGMEINLIETMSQNLQVFFDGFPYLDI